MKFIVAAIIICVALCVGGCGLGFCHDEPLVGRYVLIACDVREQMAVCTREKHGAATVVAPCVFAVGFDQEFIIAAQHPDVRSTLHPERSVTNYWLVRVADGHVEGPLHEADFDRERAAKGVSPSLAFTRVFEDLK